MQEVFGSGLAGSCLCLGLYKSHGPLFSKRSWEEFRFLSVNGLNNKPGVLCMLSCLCTPKSCVLTYLIGNTIYLMSTVFLSNRSYFSELEIKIDPDEFHLDS